MSTAPRLTRTALLTALRLVQANRRVLIQHANALIPHTAEFADATVAGDFLRDLHLSPPDSRWLIEIPEEENGTCIPDRVRLWVPCCLRLRPLGRELAAAGQTFSQCSDYRSLQSALTYSAGRVSSTMRNVGDHADLVHGIIVSVRILHALSDAEVLDSPEGCPLS